MRKTVNDHKDEIINGLIAARQSILAAVNQLAPEQVDEPCIGTWPVKDLLAHLVGWDFTNLQAVQEILAGSRPSFFNDYDKDWRTYNARLVALYRRDSLQETIVEAEASHAQLVAFLQSLPARILMEAKSPSEQGRSVTARNLLRAESSDEHRHAAEVRAYFQQKIDKGSSV